MKTKIKKGDDDGEYEVHIKRGHRFARVGAIARVNSTKWSWHATGHADGFAKTKKMAVEKLVASLPVE